MKHTSINPGTPGLKPPKRIAHLYRMATADHLCPFGLKSLHLLRIKGYHVDDKQLTSRAETDAFKQEHGVSSTPQTFIEGGRVGGYDDLRRFFGQHVPEEGETSYRPVIALFSVTALMAMAMSIFLLGSPITLSALLWFVAFSMCVLAILKLQNVEQFSTMFLNYDLLARRWVPYAYLYPFGEALAGILMIAGVLKWVAVPVALFIGTVGAVSVFKAVYIDKRELKCACVGGGSNVPLGFISLTENLMMIAMAIWIAFASPA